MVGRPELARPVKQGKASSSVRLPGHYTALHVEINRLMPSWDQGVRDGERVVELGIRCSTMSENSLFSIHEVTAMTPYSMQFKDNYY